MTDLLAFRRSQLYRFLADTFLYPTDNWLADWPLLTPVLQDLHKVLPSFDLAPWNLKLESLNLNLADLQAQHRQVFGLAGSLCYETECGLPHEFRQSQEMADIAGFYRAFGFQLGGPVRERPDHVAAELEFMHILALKEAYALERGIPEQVEVCVEAQAKFVRDHVGRWLELLAQAIAKTAPETLYARVAQCTAQWVAADAARLGVTPEMPTLRGAKPTPLDPVYSCAGCAVAETGAMEASDTPFVAG